MCKRARGNKTQKESIASNIRFIVFLQPAVSVQSNKYNKPIYYCEHSLHVLLAFKVDNRLVHICL